MLYDSNEDMISLFCNKPSLWHWQAVPCKGNIPFFVFQVLRFYLYSGLKSQLVIVLINVFEIYLPMKSFTTSSYNGHSSVRHQAVITLTRDDWVRNNS